MMKRNRGAVLTEAVLVIIPFLVISIGFTEYLWYVHMRISLTAAADAAVHFVATDHFEIQQGGGSSPNSLTPLLAGADAAARAHLTAMGFSDSVVSSMTVSIDYIQQIAASNPRYASRGIPQKEGRRLVGAVVSIPMEHAMLFGDFATNVLQLSTNTPSELSVVVFMWKQWKKES